MILKLNPSSETPIYVQLRNQIVLAIGNGQLAYGQGLPTVRQLAAETGINVMTVNKAYQLLKAEGFIEIDRRHGAVVKPCEDIHGIYEEKLESELELLVAEAKLKGITKENFLNKCLEYYERLNVRLSEGESL